jgi:hypothetical protein
MLLHLDLHEVARKVMLTDEAVGVPATDDIDGRNDVDVEESAPRLAP